MRTPEIETERLFLRPLKEADAPQAYTNWTSDDDVAKFMRWDTHQNVGTTAEWLRDEEANIEGDNYVWGFVLKATGELIGSAGLITDNEHGCYELGYNIMKKYWGMGLTTEGAKAILAFAKQSLKAEKIFCCHALDNHGSRRVIEKLGFCFDKNGSYTSENGKKSFASKEYFLKL